MRSRYPSTLPSHSCIIGLALALALIPISSVQAAATSAATPAMKAEADGHAIALSDVSRYHCHDVAFPLIRCFTTAAARDADELATAAGLAPMRTGTRTVTAGSPTFYVRWYLDANYGGPSFDASIAYRDLGAIGWNDKISSFSTYAGGHARWWRDIGFAGVGWDWGAGVSVPNVGAAANDQFSSVERL